jgi:hypothetical protein
MNQNLNVLVHGEQNQGCNNDYPKEIVVLGLLLKQYGNVTIRYYYKNLINTLSTWKLIFHWRILRWKILVIMFHKRFSALENEDDTRPRFATFRQEQISEETFKDEEKLNRRQTLNGFFLGSDILENNFLNTKFH